MQSAFKRIVVPTDFSETSETAVKLAVEVGVYYQSNLDVVNVVDATVYAYAGYPFASLSKELMTSAEAALQRLKLPAGAESLQVNRFILSGTVATEIAEHANRHKADLIVVGTHGRGVVGRFLLGSVADRVLHEAKVPVLITKAPAGKIKHPKKKTKPFRKVLFPTDFSDTANKALKRAIAITEDMDAELYVLHIVDDTLISTHVPEERKMILTELRRHALDQMRATLPSELMANFETIGAVRRGEPGKQISAYAESMGCDLIVMGSHGRTGVERVLLGSIADKVVRRAKCAVLIERADRKK